jgi:hypothetical protein
MSRYTHWAPWSQFVYLGDPSATPPPLPSSLQNKGMIRRAVCPTRGEDCLMCICLDIHTGPPGPNV